MPQLLIKTQQTGSGPGAYLRGQVVGVYSDTHVFGAREGLPRFVVVEVSQSFVDSQPELAREENDADGGLIRRRLWRLDVDALPPGILMLLENTGRANVAAAALEAILGRETRTPAAPGAADVVRGAGRG